MPHERSNFELNDLLAKNDAGEAIPPYSIAKVTNTELVSGKKPKVVIDKPDGSSGTHVATGPIEIADGATSAHVRSFDQRRWVRYSDGPPAFGEEWGPIDGSWELDEGGSGFTIWGVDETNGLALINGNAGPRKAKIVKPIYDIEPGTIGRCDVYEGPLGAEVATGETIFGYSYSLLIAEGTRCWAEHVSRIQGGECRPLTSDELSSGFSSNVSSSSLEGVKACWELFPTSC